MTKIFHFWIIFLVWKIFTSKMWSTAANKIDTCGMRRRDHQLAIRLYPK